MHLSDESFETYELDPPPYSLDTTKKELKKMYYDMVSMRCVHSTSRKRARSGEGGGLMKAEVA